MAGAARAVTPARVAFALAAALSACVATNASRDPPAPPPASSSPTPPSAPPAPPLVADAGTDAPVTAPVGVFRMRAKLVAAPGLTCLAGFQDLAALPSGGAWVAGHCGTRVRLDADGKVEDFSEPWQLTSVPVPGYGATIRCPETASFWGIWARSDHEAFAVSDGRCGTDPNLLWGRPLDRFDGTRWRLTKALPPAGPHEGIPEQLAGTTRELYTLVTGDEWHGPPQCALLRYARGSWGKPELTCPPPRTPRDRVMVLKSLAVAADGAVWVAGQIWHDGKATAGMLWSRDAGAKKWTETRVDDLELQSVSVGAGGSVWAAGTGLWRREAAGFVRVAPAGEPIASLWAESSTRAWLVRSGPQVFDGGRVLPVAIDPTQDSVTRIRGSGEHVWAISRGEVWRLERGSARGDVSRILVTRPIGSDYPEQ